MKKLISFLHVCLISLQSLPTEAMFGNEELELSLLHQNRASHTASSHNIGVSNSEFSTPLLISDYLTENDNEETGSPLHVKLLNSINEEDELSNCFTRTKVIISLFGFGAGIPLIAAASKAGDYYGSEILGDYLSGVGFLCAGLIATWMIWELMDFGKEAATSNNDTENNQQRSETRGQKTAKICTSVVLGCLSSAPEVYTAYKYNSAKWLAIVSLVYEAIPRTLGFHMFLQSFSLSFNCSRDRQMVEARKYHDFIRAKFIDYIKEKSIENLLNLLSEQHEVNDKVCILKSELGLDFDDMGAQSDYFFGGIPKKAVQIISLVFPLGGTIINSVLTYKGYKLLVDNPFFTIPMTCLSIIPIAILNGNATYLVFGGFFDKIFAICNSTLPSDYLNTFFPKTRIGFGIIGTLLASSASLSGIFIIIDNLSGTVIESMTYPLVSLSVTSSVTFGSFAIFATLSNFFQVYLKKNNTAAKQTLIFLKKIEDSKGRLQNASITEVREFLENWQRVED